MPQNVTNLTCTLPQYFLITLLVGITVISNIDHFVGDHMSVSSSWITEHYLTRQPIKAVSSTTSFFYHHICYKDNFVIHNKSAKLTQNKP